MALPQSFTVERTAGGIRVDGRPLADLDQVELIAVVEGAVAERERVLDAVERLERLVSLGFVRRRLARLVA